MCIRDSLGGDLHRHTADLVLDLVDSLLALLRNVGLGLLLEGSGLCAVSYTHLDVYKRQPVDREAAALSVEIPRQRGRAGVGFGQLLSRSQRLGL